MTTELIGFVFLLVLYFLPSAVAVLNKHKQINPIMIINLLLGWTILGWVIALAWSVSNNKDK